MPNTVVKRGAKYRLVEKATGKIVKNKAGTAVDGGGSTDKSKVVKQAQAIAIHRAGK